LLLRALCPRGAEPQITAELNRLPDVKDVAVAAGAGGVRFFGALSTLYRANLELRCASRLLVELCDATCRGPEDLYAAAFGLPWEEFLSPQGTLAVSAHGTLPDVGLSNSMFVALRVKDAICDRFRARYGRRPDVSVQSPDLRIHVQLYSEGAGRGQRGLPRMVISLDSSDTPLHERGYRVATVEAPLKETLAATFVEIALRELPAGPPPVDRDGAPILPTVVDLCCGSGTLLVEAGLRILRKSPGLLRTGGKARHFGFMGWRTFDPGSFQRIVDESGRQLVRGGSVFLHGYDLDRQAISAARRNLGTAGLSPFSQIQLGDLRSVEPPVAAVGLPTPEAPRIVLCNPPYGERMGEQDQLVSLYRALGDTLKRRFTGYSAYVYTANLDLAKQIGLRPSARHILFNGPLEGRLLEFKLY
jgi:putative N6-adenine-specific DNA methylase